MKAHAALASLLVLGASAAVHAASDVSAKYDGVFTGTAVVALAMGAGSCSDFDVGDITIAQGFLRSARDPLRPTVTGFITEEGYVAAHMARPNKTAHPMDGRMENDVIVAGYIDSAEDCYWVVRLHRKP